jgi:hypothetical protein
MEGTTRVFTAISVPPFFDIGAAEEVYLPFAVEIGDRAFYNNTTLRRVIAPNLRSVGRKAFMHCGALDLNGLSGAAFFGPFACAYAGTGCDLDLGNCIYAGDYAFLGATVTSIIAPNIQDVGQGVFAASTVRRLSLQQTASVGNGFAMQCTHLVECEAPKASHIGIGAFSDCIALESVFLGSVAVITTRAFCNCAKLTSVDFRSVFSIDNDAFSGSGIASVYAPMAYNVGNRAFAYCRQLHTVALPACRVIGTRAFEQSGLSEINAELIHRIGRSAFSNCNGLSADFGVLGSGHIEIGPSAFAGAKIDCIICSRRLSIGKRAFAQSVITVLSLPFTVELQNEAFLEATIYTDVRMHSLPVIGTAAFKGARLRNVLLSYTGSMQPSAFAYCSASTICVGSSLLPLAAFAASQIECLILPRAWNVECDTFDQSTIGRLTSDFRRVSSGPIFTFRYNGRVRTVRVISTKVFWRVLSAIVLTLQKCGLHSDAIRAVLWATPDQRFISCNTAAASLELMAAATPLSV